jgi:hypothetical protein
MTPILQPQTMAMDPVGHTYCSPHHPHRPTHFTHTHFERFERLEENWNDGGQSGGDIAMSVPHPLLVSAPPPHHHFTL